MIDRTNAVLAALLALVLAASYLLAPAERTRTSTGRVFAANLVASAARVEITRDGAELALVRRDTGGWSLADPAGFPAAESRVERVVLDPLDALVGADLVASSSEGLGFDGVATGVRVLDAGGRVLAAFDQVAPAGSGRGSFVRVRGGDAVHRAAALPVLEPAPAAFWDGRLVAGDPSSVRAFAIEYPVDPSAPAGERRRVAFVREASGAWTVDGRAAPSVVAIDTAAQQLARLRLVGLVAAAPLPEHGLAAPLLVFEVETAAGAAAEAATASTRIAIGEADPQGRLFATTDLHAEPFVVLVDAAAANAVLEPVVGLLGR